MKKIVLSTILTLGLLLTTVNSAQAATVMCAGGYTGGAQATNCQWFASGDYGYCGWADVVQAGCTCPGGQMSSEDCKCNAEYAGPPRRTTFASSCNLTQATWRCLCSGDNSVCTNKNGSCGTAPYTGYCTVNCVQTQGSCTANYSTVTHYCSTSDPPPTSAPTPSSPPPTTPPVTPIADYIISGNLYNTPNTTACTDRTLNTSLSGAVIRAYRAGTSTLATSTTLTAGQTSYGLTVPGGYSYDIEITIPAASTYTCGCTGPYGGNNKVCRLTNQGQTSAAHFLLINNYTIAGQYRSSDTAACTAGATSQATVSGATSAVYSSGGTLLQGPTANTTGFSYSLQAGQSYNIRLTIPAATPFVCASSCSGQTLVGGNNKICQQSITPSADLSNLHFYLVPTASITGSFYTTTEGSYPPNCGGVSGSALSLSSSFIRLRNAGGGSDLVTTSLNPAGSYSFPNLPRNLRYDLYLNVDPASSYVCACPSAIDSDGKVCLRTNAEPGSAYPFYLIDLRYVYGSWFQVWGGNIFASDSIYSPIPYLTCNSAASCIDALLLRQSGNQMSVGFPLLGSEAKTDLSTTDTGLDQWSYIHELGKTPNTNTYATGALPQTPTYDYLLRNLNFIPPVTGGGTINLNNWRSADWWVNTLDGNGNRYVMVNGDMTITEGSNFTLTAGEKLTVFVSGSLTINDTNPADSNRRISNVPAGAVLVFIVQGNIDITPNVGYNLDPSAPSVPAVTLANSNLSGVFIADGNLTVQSKSSNPGVYGSLPDRKLIGDGSFIAWGNISLNRSFGDSESPGAVLNSMQATENFIFRPDFTASWPEGLKSRVSRWTEKNPRSVDTSSW